MHPGTSLDATASAATFALLLAAMVMLHPFFASFPKRCRHSYGAEFWATIPRQHERAETRDPRSMDESPSTASEDERRLVALMIAYQSGDLGAFEQLYGLL